MTEHRRTRDNPIAALERGLSPTSPEIEAMVSRTLHKRSARLPGGTVALAACVLVGLNYTTTALVPGSLDGGLFDQRFDYPTSMQVDAELWPPTCDDPERSALECPA